MHSKLIAASLLAATFSINAAESTQAARPDERPNDIVCTVEHSTGSHLPKRNCTTRAARDAQAKADQEALRNLHQPVKPNSAASR